jgi:hypothetical protein
METVQVGNGGFHGLRTLDTPTYHCLNGVLRMATRPNSAATK